MNFLKEKLKMHRDTVAAIDFMNEGIGKLQRNIHTLNSCQILLLKFLKIRVYTVRIPQGTEGVYIIATKC